MTVYVDSPYGVTFYVGPNNPLLPAGTITDLAGLGNSGADTIPIWARYQEQWNLIEPTFSGNRASPTYDWSNMADIVPRLHATNCKILWPVQGAPRWWWSIDANGNAVNYDGTHCKTTLNMTIHKNDALTSITVNALPGGATLANGALVCIDEYTPGQYDVVTINHGGGYSAGATTLTIQPYTAQHNHNPGVAVWDSSGAVLPNGTDMAQFVTAALAQSWATGIDEWQIGNEEWDTANRNGGPLGPVAAACYPLIKAAFPSKRVGVCSVRKTPKNAASHVQSWVTNFLNNGGSGKADFLDFHYYRDGTLDANGVLQPDPTVPTPNCPSVTQEIAIIQSVITSFGLTIPVYACETGWGTDVVTTAQQSAYIIAMMDAFINNAPTGRCFVYTLDNSNDTKSMTPTAYSALQAYIVAHPQWPNVIGPGSGYVTVKSTLPTPNSLRKRRIVV